MIDFFSLPLILLYAALFGGTMKLADLFNEHGMKWFKGDAIIFGILWGFFGSLLVLSRIDIANVILALVLACLLRMRIDYFNHVIAVVMIILTFVWKSELDLVLFLVFFAIFALFGSIRDYFGDIRKKKDWLYTIGEIPWYMFLAPLIYGYFIGN